MNQHKVKSKSEFLQEVEMRSNLDGIIKSSALRCLMSSDSEVRMGAMSILAEEFLNVMEQQPPWQLKTELSFGQKNVYLDSLFQQSISGAYGKINESCQNKTNFITNKTPERYEEFKQMLMQTMTRPIELEVGKHLVRV